MYQTISYNAYTSISLFASQEYNVAYTGMLVMWHRSQWRINVIVIIKCNYGLSKGHMATKFAIL